MFSKTVSRGKIEVIWKLRDRPRRLISCGARPSIDRPFSAIVPELTAKPPADQVEQRRLAGAVGADHGMALAARNVEIDAADDLGAAEALVHALQRDGGLRSRHRPFALASAIRASQRARKPRASRRSHEPPPIRATAPSTQGKASPDRRRGSRS